MLRVLNTKTAFSILVLSSIQVFLVSALAENSAESVLTDWSQHMAVKMNNRMERKLQQIVMDAQILQNLEINSRQLTTLVEKDFGCDPVNQISKL